MEGKEVKREMENKFKLNRLLVHVFSNSFYLKICKIMKYFDYIYIYIYIFFIFIFYTVKPYMKKSLSLFFFFFP